MRRVCLPILIALALLSAGSQPAMGQTGSNTLVGSWFLIFTLPGSSDPALSVLLTCHPDGTATAMMPGFGDSAGAGAWTSAGDGQYALTTLHYDQNPPPSDMPVNGFLKLRYAVSMSGGKISGMAEAIQTDLSGALQKTVSGVSVTGTPILVEQIGAPPQGPPQSRSDSPELPKRLENRQEKEDRGRAEGASRFDRRAAFLTGAAWK